MRAHWSHLTTTLFPYDKLKHSCCCLNTCYRGAPYLQTFGQRAEQNQAHQPAQGSRHRGRLLSGARRISPAGLHPSQRTGAARREEPSRSASCHLNAPRVFSHICDCLQRYQEGFAVVIRSWRSPEKGKTREGKKNGAHVLEKCSRFPRIGPCRSEHHGG